MTTRRMKTAMSGLGDHSSNYRFMPAIRRFSSSSYNIAVLIPFQMEAAAHLRPLPVAVVAAVADLDLQPQGQAAIESTPAEVILLLVPVQRRQHLHQPPNSITELHHRLPLVRHSQLLLHPRDAG